MIDIFDLAFAYPNRAPVFRGFNWQVGRGEKWSIIGPSGCGKTTLLYLLAALRKPTGGKIVLEGEPLERPRPSTGLILQDYGLLPWATALGNVEVGLKLRGMPGKTRRSLARRWLGELGIESAAGQYPAQLSGGQRQRVAIARTLALDPHLLLMDEPFSSLDALTRESLQELVASLRPGAGLTTILVTHNIEEAVFLGKRILLLGSPPVGDALILDNPLAGTPDYRRHDAFYRKCEEVRRRVGEPSA